jgi:UDP-N-acetylmuramoyl-tripeptide--D-alanyl-D-alanine ligase
MKPVAIGLIASVTGGRYVGPPDALGRVISGVVRDSGDAFEGCLFVCVRGERTDGHNFYSAAAASGAICALAERAPSGGGPYILVDSAVGALRALGAYYRSLFDIPVIGVTGSVGKTTTKEMIAAALGRRYNVHKTPMNLNNEIGVPLTLLSLREEHTAAVIEMGISDFGEMDRLGAMARPTHCVMTAIGHCHLDALGDLDGVLRAKSEIFPWIVSGGAAIVNGDDELLYGLDPGVRKAAYGLRARNAYRAENIVSRGASGTTCDIITPSGRFGAEILAFGEHHVYAALAAAAVCDLLGAPVKETASGLLTFRPVGARANVSRYGGLTVIDDCYNANPNSLEASLRALCSLPGRRVAILGDMNELGRMSNELHRAAGRRAADLGVDFLICCGERALRIYEGFVERGGADCRHFYLKGDLIARLPGLIKSGDAVLVKASHSHMFGEISDALRALSCGAETPGG